MDGSPIVILVSPQRDFQSILIQSQRPYEYIS